MMKKIRILRLYEWHPGAKTVDETLEYFIERGEKVLGISREISEIAFGFFLDYYETGEMPERVSRKSDLGRAIKNAQTCIDTIKDDGWPKELIYLGIRKKLNQSNLV